MPKPKQPPVNRQDLIQFVANNAGLSMSEAKVAVDTVLCGVVHLADNNPYLQIHGFGRFERRVRKARINKTPVGGGEPLMNEAYEVLWFQASPSLQISLEDDHEPA